MADNSNGDDGAEREPKAILLEFDEEESIRGHTRVELTDHLIQRMEERGVSIEDVIHALRKGKQPPGKQLPGRVRLQWHKSRRERIDVVYEELSDRIGVITVIPFRSFGR